MSQGVFSDDYPRGIHSADVSMPDGKKNDNGESCHGAHHHNNDFGAKSKSQKGARGPTEEDRDTVAKAIEAYQYLNNVAHDNTSVLYPLLSSVLKNKDALKALEKVNGVKEKKVLEKEDFKQKLNDLNLQHSLKKKRFKEERRRIDQEYEKCKSEAQRKKEVAIQEAIERHNSELARIKREHTESISSAAVKKHESILEISNKQKNEASEHALRRREYTKKLESIDSYLVKVKEARAQIVFKCFFQDDAMGVLKTIAEAVQSHLSKNTKKNNNEQIFRNKNIHPGSKIQEVQPTTGKAPDQVNEKAYESAPLNEHELRQRRREEERRKREQDALSKSHDDYLYSQLMRQSIKNQHDSLINSTGSLETHSPSLSSSSSSFGSKETSNRANKDSVISTERRRRSREEKPKFLRKFNRQKRTKNNRSSQRPQHQESVQREREDLFTLHSVNSSRTPQLPNPKERDGSEDSGNIEFIGGGVKQTLSSERGLENDVEELVNRIRQQKKGIEITKQSDQIKRARLERELACSPTPSAQLEHITESSGAKEISFQEATDQLTKSLEDFNPSDFISSGEIINRRTESYDLNNKKDSENLQQREEEESSQVVSFDEVLGAVVPYKGPAGVRESFVSSRLYDAYSSSSTSSDTEEDYYDSSEYEGDMAFSDGTGWIKSGDDEESLNNVYRQLAGGDVSGTQYEDLGESAKKYHSKVKDNFFRRNQFSTHGIIANPRMQDPRDRRGKKNKSRNGKLRNYRRGRGQRKKRRKGANAKSTEDGVNRKPTRQELVALPDLHLDGLMIGRVTREDDKNPGCPSIIYDTNTNPPKKIIPPAYAAQFSNIRETGPFPYYTATLLDRCGYCGYLLINCNCTCYIGHTREQCLNICYRGFHYTYEMAKAYSELMRAFNTGEEQVIRNAWQEWRKQRRNNLPDDMEKLESGFIRTFRWSDRNGNLWRTSLDKESERSSALLAITDGSYHDVQLDESHSSVSREQQAIIESAIHASNTGNFPSESRCEADDPGKVKHPFIYNVWYSKSCGSLDTNGVPTTKPPCPLCGWPSIRIKNDSFTFCSSCRNCQKVRIYFEKWSKQSGVRGSNRGRKRARNNATSKRVTKRKIYSTRFDLGSITPATDQSQIQFASPTPHQNDETQTSDDNLSANPDPLNTQNSNENIQSTDISHALVPIDENSLSIPFCLDSPMDLVDLFGNDNSLMSVIGMEDEGQGVEHTLGELTDANLGDFFGQIKE